MVVCYIGIDVGTQGLTALLVKSVVSTSSITGRPTSNIDCGNKNNSSSSSSSSLNVLAAGEGSYDFVPNLPLGCYEQNPIDWEIALIEALKKIQNEVDVDNNNIVIEAICVTGQMHGCVMLDQNGCNIGTARLWCDSRNQEEADELTELFGERVPKRLTAARFLWSLKHEPEKTRKCIALTTPAGYIAHRLTSSSVSVSVSVSVPTSSSISIPIHQPLQQRLILGIGEASGMFPIDDTGCEYRKDWIEIFDTHVRTKFPSSSYSVPSLKVLLPKIRTAGDTRDNSHDSNSNNNAVVLNESILEIDGWLQEVRDLLTKRSNTSISSANGNGNGEDNGENNKITTKGILVAPAEGDQPTALAASLIGESGVISCSFGTSVVANMVGKSNITNNKNNDNDNDNDNNKKASSSRSSSSSSMAAVDRFNAVNGQPISMVWLRNGTTYLNRMIDSYGGDFDTLLKQAIEAPTDCGGLLALPFLDDEPGLNVKRGGTALVVGFNSSNNNNDDGNHRAGNVIRAALISVMFNLYLGTEQVEKEAAAAAAVAAAEEAPQATTETKKEIVLTGGLTKTPQTGQILADIFDRPVRLMESADEGGAWGASLLAKFYHDSSSSNSPNPNDWLEFLKTIKVNEEKKFFPQSERVHIYREMLTKYRKLLKLQPQLDEVMNGP